MPFSAGIYYISIKLFCLYFSNSDKACGRFASVIRSSVIPPVPCLPVLASRALLQHPLEFFLGAADLL